MRSLLKNGTRFLSILIITTLGVAVLLGVYATCYDMYRSTDRFYDEQRMFDIRVRSTLGLTQEDVEALLRVQGIAAAEGGYGEIAHTMVGDLRRNVEVVQLSEEGFNQPRLTDGSLPSQRGEIAVTSQYLAASGKAIGDTLFIESKLSADEKEDSEAEKSGDSPNTTPEEPSGDAAGDASGEDGGLSLDWDEGDWDSDVEEDEETSALLSTTFTIVGSVVDPMNISSTSGSAFRSSNAADFTFFVCAADVDADIYTSIYLLLDGLAELNCFSQPYKQAVAEMIEKIEAEIVKQREQARYDSVIGDAQEKISDAEDTMNEKFAEADGKFADAWTEIEDARVELRDGEKTLTEEEADALKKLADASKEIQDGKRELIDAEKELADGEAEWTENRQKIADGWIELAEEKKKAEDAFAEAEETFREKEQDMRDNLRELEEGVSQLRLMCDIGWPQAEWDALTAAAAQQTMGALLADPTAGQDALTAVAHQGTAAEQAALKRQIPVGALASQAATAGVGLGIVQGSSGMVEGGLSTIQGQKSAMESDIADLKSATAAMHIPWPDAQWDALIAAAAAEAAANPQMDAAALATHVFGATTAEQADLAAFVPPPLLDHVVLAGVGYGILQGSEQTLLQQQALLAQSLSQVQAGVSQLRQMFDNPWPQAQWDKLVSAAADATEAQLDENAEIDPNLLSARVASMAYREADALAAQAPDALAQDTTDAGTGMGILLGSRRFLDRMKSEYEIEKADALQKLDEAAEELADGERKLEEGRIELTNGRNKIIDGWKDLIEGEAELIEKERDALKEIADAWEEIAEGKQELADGEIEYADNEKLYLEKRTDAERQLADAYGKLSDIKMAQWYVQDRTSVDSHSSLKNDLSSIEAVGRAFPIVFLLVSVLISLTTMTRLVEEERGLIGTYKAMGFGSMEIYGKYLLYAILASGIGGLLGIFFGFVVLPISLYSILRELYTIPGISLYFDIPYGLGSIALFMVSIVGSTYITCRKELRETPSALMRPRAPSAGSRVFLERIPALWNRLKFLNKVTARNLFRYKKRLFMTVIGITGCTALVLCGFAIRDTVNELSPRQYGKVYRYDLMVIAEDEKEDALYTHLAEGPVVAGYIALQVENIKVYNRAGAAETAQLFVIPAGVSLEPYIQTVAQDGTPCAPGGEGILLTQSAAEVLRLSPKDEITIQTRNLDRCDAQVRYIVENYLGDHVFLSQEQYEGMFGVFSPNAALVLLADSTTDHNAYAEELLAHDFVMSTISTQVIRAEFSGEFGVVNSVVYLLTVLAAGLALVVLFTLSNTNISERSRELATIKVLGFFDREVHAYVNKETLILTLIGVIAGLPVGRFVSGLLTETLKMPGLYFDIYIQPTSYLIACVISFSFALIVNLFTNTTLDRIDMVEALKSVE